MEEKEYILTPEGSLGLLALGHIGLYAWRKAREDYEKITGAKYENTYTATPEKKTTGDISDKTVKPVDEAS